MLTRYEYKSLALQTLSSAIEIDEARGRPCAPSRSSNSSPSLTPSLTSSFTSTSNTSTCYTALDLMQLYATAAGLIHGLLDSANLRDLERVFYASLLAQCQQRVAALQGQDAKVEAAPVAGEHPHGDMGSCSASLPAATEGRRRTKPSLPWSSSSSSSITTAKNSPAFAAALATAAEADSGAGASLSKPSSKPEDPIEEAIEQTILKLPAHPQQRCGEAESEDEEARSICWEGIVGQEAAKQVLEEALIFPLRYSELCAAMHLRAWSGILLFGPPGTGKTMLARVVASQLGTSTTTFFHITTSDLTSKWMGESERLVRTLFAVARKRSPSVIFIDEIDGLASRRGSQNESETSRRVKNQLLQEMDGLAEHAETPVVVLAATNTPQDLDAAILRRFQQRVFVPGPTLDDRVAMFYLHLRRLHASLSAEEVEILAQQTEGYSGADISAVVARAKMSSLRQLHSARHFRRVSAGRESAETSIVRIRWMPCQATDEGAVTCRLADLPPPLHESVLLPAIGFQDLANTIERVRPATSRDDPQQRVELEQWNRQFGTHVG